MKRMNEVLCRKLPIDGFELRHIILNETSCPDDNLIAHAINNVDALADTLETVLSVLSGKTEYSSSEIDLGSCYVVLNAYRGAK